MLASPAALCLNEDSLPIDDLVIQEPTNLDLEKIDEQSLLTDWPLIPLDQQSLPVDQQSHSNDHSLATDEQLLPADPQSILDNHQSPPTAQLLLLTDQQSIPADPQPLPYNQQPLPADQQTLPANQKLLPANQLPPSANPQPLPADRLPHDLQSSSDSFSLSSSIVLVNHEDVAVHEGIPAFNTRSIDNIPFIDDNEGSFLFEVCKCAVICRDVVKAEKQC